MYIFVKIKFHSFCHIVLQWDLVCDKDFLVDTTQTIYVLGVLAGALVCTTLADNFGRKKVFIISQMCTAFVGVITSFVHNIYAFALLRFAAGFLQQVFHHNSMHVYPVSWRNTTMKTTYFDRHK